MTIEELRTYLTERLTLEETNTVIAAVLTLRSKAYNEGWDDCSHEQNPDS